MEEQFLKKTNWGVIQTYPQICINQFRLNQDKELDERMYFMTHCDTQILDEILDINFLMTLNNYPTENNIGPRLFLHEHMLEFLKAWAKEKDDINGDLIADLLKHGKECGRIVTSKINRTFSIFFHGDRRIVNVTMLPSGYDIGCVMLYFSIKNLDLQDSAPTYQILYTGNCRFSMKDIKMCPALVRALDYKPIHELYIDTSYFHEEVTELPLRYQSTKFLVETIKETLERVPFIHLEITAKLPETLGQLLYDIAEEIHSPIHVPETLATFYNKVPALTYRMNARDDEELRIHYGCAELKDNEDCARGKDWGIHVDVKRINLWREMTRKPNPAIRGNPLLVWAETGIEVENSRDVQMLDEMDTITGFYANHMSRYEIGRLIRHLKIPVSPQTIFPLYKPSDRSMDQVMRLMSHTMNEINWTPEPHHYMYEHFAATYDGTYLSHAERTESDNAPNQMFHFDNA